MTMHIRNRIAVAGASGRMGHMLIEAIQAADDCELAGALDMAGSPAIGTDATAFLGQTGGVAITSVRLRYFNTPSEESAAYIVLCSSMYP